MAAAAGELAKLCRQIVESRFRLTRERLTQNLAMLGLGRTTMPGRAPFEA